MDFITYFLSALVSLFGVLAGSYLANSAPQEVHNLKKYFPLAQMLSLVLLFFVLYTFFPFFIVTAILILTFTFLRFFWHRQNVNILDYTIFGIIFPLSSLIMVAHYYITLIVFIFGIFSGALFYVLHTHPKKKTHKHVAYHKHRGRHHTHEEILLKLFSSYSFFLLLSLTSYLVANLFMLFI